MNRFYLFVVLSLFSCKYFGQTILTNGMVYNYSVGDTIKYDIQVNAGPPISYTVSYIQKTIKTDTFLYQVKQQFYQPAPCMTCSPSAGITTYSSQVTDLNANAIHFVLTNTLCTTQYDSLYTNGCGQIVNLRQNNWEPTCFEPDMYKSYLVEGVGLFYEYSFGQDPNHDIHKKILTYYHKVGQAPCGGNGMPLITKENNILDKVSIFPNPLSNERISIKNESREDLTITVNSIEGKEILRFNLKSIDSDINLKIASGLYFMKIQKNNSADFITRKIIVE